MVCLGGRGPLDDAAAAMLAQVLKVQGAEVVVARHSDIATRRSRDLMPKEADAIVVCLLNEDSVKHAGLLVRRFKRIYTGSRVGAVLLSDGPEPRALPPMGDADFIASTLTRATREALRGDAPTTPVVPRKIHIRRRSTTKGATDQV
ncbi:conserved protein of unknown function (plasmid) [Agrobacterium pusense]|uniref:Uncharacterized protein n=1 Tax=Agrobacterium pusense TaxID=648995 RepID=U4Q592_9HYPH|nr:conserved protein of unknown function [Agrobacterium pusense]